MLFFKGNKYSNKNNSNSKLTLNTYCVLANVASFLHVYSHLIFFFFSLALSSKLECSGTIIGYCNLELLSSSNPSSSASRVTGTTGIHPPCLANLFFHRVRVLLCCPGWNAMVQSQLTATYTSWVQLILLPQPPG